jgi:hypothetical protein
MTQVTQRYALLVYFSRVQSNNQGEEMLRAHCTARSREHPHPLSIWKALLTDLVGFYGDFMMQT